MPLAILPQVSAGTFSRLFLKGKKYRFILVTSDDILGKDRFWIAFYYVDYFDIIIFPLYIFTMSKIYLDR